MPARLPDGQKPVVMASYPHMLAEDVEVWTAYLREPVVPIERVWYDVRVGAPVSLGPGADSVDRRIAAGLTRKRIDVIAQCRGRLWVIEVKPRGSYLALGQALTYWRLFVQEFEPAMEVLGAVVCLAADQDLLSEYDAQNVVLIEVGLPKGIII